MINFNFLLSYVEDCQEQQHSKHARNVVPVNISYAVQPQYHHMLVLTSPPAPLTLCCQMLKRFVTCGEDAQNAECHPNYGCSYTALI